MTFLQGPEEVTDLEAVAQAKKDPEAFGMIIERYSPRILAFVGRITAFEKEEREDIVQETFIKAYRSLNAFDPSLRFSTWLFRIAHNTAIDAWRREKNKPGMTSIDEADITHLFKASTDLHREVISTEESATVRKAIDSLPYNYREILILKFIEDKSYEEIMDILQKPKGTVAALIHRGKKLLKEAITKQYPHLT